jgi:hypothetical protein
MGTTSSHGIDANRSDGDSLPRVVNDGNGAVIPFDKRGQEIMMTRSVRWRPFAVAVAALGLVAGPLGTGATAAAPPAVPAAAACPAAVPVAEIKAGLTGTGLTVSHGTTPEPFSVTVLGVLPGGIAPGVDLIVFQGHSPAVDTNGIWAGMSGSPVYTKDGRLLGAVSYGFTAAPSSIGGITPAAAMNELFDNPAAVGTHAPAGTVALPADLRRALADRGAPSGAGLAPLPVPVAVSGLSAARLANGARIPAPLHAYAAGAAPGTPAPAGGIVPGGNFAAAISYGDVTEAGIGTTTEVCNGRALAFGHPLVFGGAVSFSAHTADAIAVVKDATLGSFKLASVGGVAGTVDQDRTVGLRATLGAGPKGTVPVRSTVTSGTRSRTATTWVTMDSYLADVTLNHLLANVDRVFDQVGPGQSTVSWTIRGTAGTGTTWKLSRTDRYASTFDAAFESVTEVFDQISAIVDNPYSTVKVTDVSLTADVVPGYAAYNVDAVQVKKNGSWVDVTDSLPVTAGKPLDLRLRLTAYRAPARFVPVTLNVPAGSFEGGNLSVVGGLNQSSLSPAKPTFAAVLAALRDSPRNDDLTVALDLTGSGKDTVLRQVLRQDHVVSGELDAGVATG